MAMLNRNRLDATTSPYLLQHADNPVHWQPWEEDVLAEAKRLDRPILLSIGYSACHWCHVMAHESFEDAATAAVMNEAFVNIKVDREERPDLDRIYQLAHQVLARRAGGWPLTVFLDPEDHRPFFAGTYFPPRPSHGLPSFADLLRHMAEVFHNRREEVREQNRELAKILDEIGANAGGGGGTIDAAPWLRFRQAIGGAWDRRHGGFGGAPKFPHPTMLEAVLSDVEAGLAGEDDRRQLRFTLERMAMGGVFDALAGGFFRYSVDERWEIPHFEKMLYDNGQLLGLYARAGRAFGDDLFRRVAGRTGDWMLAEMIGPDGGLASALDADSEGHEGAYYVWTQDEVASVLDQPAYLALASCYGLDRPANFEGRWHLHGAERCAETEALAAARSRLASARGGRVRPGRDDKILAAWNGLAVRGLAIAGRLDGRRDFVATAAMAVDFAMAELWRGGRLLASYRAGQAAHPAYLDDHAFLIDGIVELLQVRWDSRHLGFALALADLLLAHFADPAGGFFFTADDHEALIQRPKPWADEAIPAGNGVAVRALLRLGWLLAEPRYLEAAEASLAACAGALAANPEYHATLLDGLREYLEPPEIVILRAPAEKLAALAAGEEGQGKLVFAIPAEAEGLPAALAEKACDGNGRIYRCRGTECRAAERV